jgi:Domain of Unknown Function (DUF1080)
MARGLSAPGNSSPDSHPTASIPESGGPSRRDLIATAAAVSLSIAFGDRPSVTAEADVRFDFTKPLAGWETVDGQWAIEDVPGAIQGKALVQRAISNSFNVIVAPGGPYINMDVSVRFKPISGREDASGGIVFRFADGRYYLIRANALEDNFNLYYFDRSAWFTFLTGGRFEITGASTKAPALGAWHTLRIAAQGDHIEGWLNGQRLIDHHDSRFTAGRVGLWTKADSITAFDSLVVRPL